ncbi:MAG: (d)CMP kinase [Flavobacteriales bacterium]|nr:(d)CMP kinase [Flavobacteriales bacterium]
MSASRINIAIDGHSSAGKSTMAKSLAKELSFVYVDTGAMYRAAALFCMRERLILGNEIEESRVEQAIDRMFISFKYNPTSETSDVHLGGVNVEKEIRSMDVARKVSLVAAIPAVRHKLVRLQQRMADKGGVVMDGRDIGTIVLPNAKLKFFITSDPDIRAQRRLNEMHREGITSSFEEVRNNIIERDRIDSSRAVAPLRQAEDSIVLDNSNLTIEEQFQFLLSHAKKTISSKQ